MKHKRGNEIEIEQTLGYSSVTEPVAARISGHSSTIKDKTSTGIGTLY